MLTKYACFGLEKSLNLVFCIESFLTLEGKNDVIATPYFIDSFLKVVSCGVGICRELRTYCWSGENQFFVKASWDSLSIGAGSGRYGLWLDSDFNHGRSQRCETFQNEPLSGEEGDFTIQLIEAFGFRMG